MQVNGALPDKAAVDHSGFLDAVSDESETRRPNWIVGILMGKQKIQFKLDTVAEVTTMSDLSYRKLHGVCMFKASGVLFGPNHTNTDVFGQFSQTLTYGERKSKLQVFVIKGLKSNLLGLPVVEVLKLAARLDSTDSCQARIVADHPSVFHGVSVLGGPYQDKVQKDPSQMESL